MGKSAIIIPARYGSSRLEGKPLLKVLDKPVIQWVYEKAQASKLADIIIVATDDQRIYDCVKDFGGEVEMTSTEHKSGSDRIMEVVSRHPEIDYICNLQGDEPLIEPDSIDAVIKHVIEDAMADISTLIRVISAKVWLELRSLINMAISIKLAVKLLLASMMQQKIYTKA